MITIEENRTGQSTRQCLSTATNTLGKDRISVPDMRDPWEKKAGSFTFHILFFWAYCQYPEVAIEFLTRVGQRGHTLSVLLGKKKEKVEKAFSRSDMDTYFPPSLDIGSTITGTPYPVFSNVSRYLKMIKPDIVHVNSHLFFSSYQIVKAANSLDIPSVVTVHGFSVRRNLVADALQEVYLRTMAMLLFKKVTAVICLTRSDAEKVTNIIGDNDKTYVIPNAVDAEFFRPSSVKDPKLVAWVGRFVPEKGLTYLLKAMQKVSKERDGARLVLVGSGPMENELANLVSRLHLGNNIFFVGSASRAEVASILSKSSIFAFPSLEEGLPLSVLEAMASGTPIVGSAIPGISSIVTHKKDGLLVPTKDTEALADAILALLDDEKIRREMGLNARRLMVEKYDWDTIGEKIDSIYAQAIRGNPSSD